MYIFMLTEICITFSIGIRFSNVSDTDEFVRHKIELLADRRDVKESFEKIIFEAKETVS